MAYHATSNLNEPRAALGATNLSPEEVPRLQAFIRFEDAKQEAKMEDIRHWNLNALLVEAKTLSGNRVIMQSQEGAHVVNLLCRVLETIIDGEPKTKPISTHHS